MLKNRTNAYLKRILNLWGKTLSSELVRIENKIIGVYFDDRTYRKVTGDEEDLFFFLLNLESKKIDPQTLLFLKFIRKSGAYKTDYPVLLFKTHVVVFKSRPGFEKAFQRFKEFKYSEMYTKEQLKELKFPEKVNGQISHCYCVVHKDPRGMSKFKAIIQERFNTKHTPTGEINEYDIPWIPHQEILNYDCTKG